jgi:hypothetical protein
MYTWWIVNLDTGETRTTRAHDNASACRVVGWCLDYCVARIVPPREVR